MTSVTCDGGKEHWALKDWSLSMTLGCSDDLEKNALHGLSTVGCHSADNLGCRVDKPFLKKKADANIHPTPIREPQGTKQKRIRGAAGD